MTILEIQTATTNLFNETDKAIAANPGRPWLVKARGALSEAGGHLGSDINDQAAAQSGARPVATPLQPAKTPAVTPAGNGRPSA